MWDLDYKESWAQKNWCFWTVVLEKTLESPLGCKEIQPVHSEGDQSWVFIGRTDAKAATPILWPLHAKSWLIGRLWCWEGLGAGGEGDNRGRDGWMASPTRWTWVWVNSGSWWWTERPGVLRFMGSQRVGHNWATELNWTDSSEILDLYLDFVKLTVLKSLLNLLQYCFCSSHVLGFCLFLFFVFGQDACGISAFQPGITPTPHALEGKVLTLDGLGSPYSFLSAY